MLLPAVCVGGMALCMRRMRRGGRAAEAEPEQEQEDVRIPDPQEGAACRGLREEVSRLRTYIELARLRRELDAPDPSGPPPSHG